MAQSASTVKRVGLELGGNAPFLIFDDADIEMAVAGVMASKFRNGGQTCVCANRILVQAGVYEAFARRLARAMSALQVGDGLAEGTTIGPMINAAAIAKIERHVEDAHQRGARVPLGGRTLRQRFFEPTLVTEATRDMRLAHEETFGPVGPLFRFTDEAEAITIANDTPYGLAAYLYTRDVARCFRVADALEVGMIGINSGGVSYGGAPFGGVKESGLGREGGPHGIDEFLETARCISAVFESLAAEDADRQSSVSNDNSATPSR
jgi:succinate-semialdehyde dehydrogenase/glutarate-semialdehyde dehydrogenase